MPLLQIKQKRHMLERLFLSPMSKREMFGDEMRDQTLFGDQTFSRLDTLFDRVLSA